MKKVIFFSHNKNKIKEVLNFFNKTKINILSLDSFQNILEIKETGYSFEENAKIKSNYGYKKLKLPCFADDSGICISAMNNFPGIKSKRFLEKHSSYKKTFATIINETKKFSDNRAYFQTSISLTLNQNKTIFFNGVVKGEISSEPKGEYGFHYDPIFIPNGYNKTFAEMPPEEKNKISHRAIAIKKLIKYLIQLFN